MDTLTRLDTLPTELLDAIVSHLGDRDLASLLAANRKLYLQFDPIFYSREHVMNLAMGWACSRGNIQAIRRLVSLGASPSVVEASTSSSGYYIKTSTLLLAATKKQVEAFRYLIDIGARLDDPDVDKGAIRHFVSRICSPTQDWALLRLYLDAGLDDQLRMGHYRHYPPSTVPLLGLISQSVSAPPLELVRQLLDRGGNPNEIFSYYGNRLVTPLTVAIRKAHTEALDILIEKGGIIHGPYVTRPVRQPWHIPIMAAAACMSTQGTTVIEQCLHHGADINYSTPLICEDTHHGREHHRYMSPALVYVDSIHNWDEPTHALHPVDGLKFLLSRGALLQKPIPIPDRGALERIHRAPWVWCHWSPSPMCLDFILEKWGLSKFITSPGLVLTVQYLLRHAVSIGTLAESLVAYEYQTGVYTDLPVQISGAWQGLLTYVLEDLKVDPTILLSQYILQKALCIWNKPLHKIGRATIERLLASGANINARMGAEDGPTALHAVCEAFNKELLTLKENFHPYSWWEKLDIQATYLEYLASRGADSSIRIDCQTASEALLVNQADMPLEARQKMLSIKITQM
uniref:F-box domain-containing protein n=1 Tax=Penicillium aethiopicum TaxID=36650 RepID=D7PI03_PENAE|nr:unknown [Penicillium aethiopicum]